ncbi:hypothetical protein CAPTEDRAFT_205903 [Capitella teleta]|uniref:Uncharacterized protein n=1 Tax=Capitella teleta TaxID=283909 RepID=R7UE92_CAPTE|nr:hypothetical protein CAPTEDRAFT_205903 [Capitella teleta]|eukprot:ELU04854.1 hypothetical protein CAPTEDRAFT_205903 [Capitella teleta]
MQKLIISLLFVAVLLPWIEAHFRPVCLDHDCFNACVVPVITKYNIDMTYTCREVCIEPKGCKNVDSSTSMTGKKTACMETDCFDGCGKALVARYSIRDEDNPLPCLKRCMANGAC